ncbi:type II toxin-antitoxin system RelE/ParE family toxin [Desulfobacter vibrioformis]|uniref:type II toxin-antitoxin system RelE/ParE family toxin n=1 Tax=Desulfobacter vibrioformis TaxID=34031 RepID=UPI0009FE29D0|nr:type II toxin-antitoxin system RelE/ParE family toxin [Desulfobacter vibrioformis]
MTDVQATKVAWVLKLIREIDQVPSKYFKKLVNTNDIWEVRVDVGRDTFRLLGFFDGQELIILTNSFQKKSLIFAKNFDKGYEHFKIGVLLKQARLDAGLTQEDVANLLNTKKSAISRICQWGVLSGIVLRGRESRPHVCVNHACKGKDLTEGRSPQRKLVPDM